MSPNLLTTSASVCAPTLGIERSPLWAKSLTTCQVVGNIISASDIIKTYVVGDQTIRALDGVSFDIAAGDFVAIMGASGSGKSTLMNLIGALDVPSSGKLAIDGRNVQSMDSDERAALRNQNLGFVFQQSNLLARTPALRQVMLPLLYARPRHTDPKGAAKECLEQVGLGNRLNHYPHQLSGGQQQRVAIARALVNKPSLLLADEPTGALDSTTSRSIMALFKALNKAGHTIVLVTHDPDIAAMARRTMTLRDGKIIDDVATVPFSAIATGGLR